MAGGGGLDSTGLEVLRRSPAGTARPAPLLFVHGAWHGAWCWDKHLMPHLAAAGYECHALSLRGHAGSPGRERLRWTSLADYVADVAEVAAALRAPPVLVGHSMGGAVVQKYLEDARRPAAAMVLLASVPPTTGALLATLRAARRQPLRFLRANLTFSLHRLVDSPAAARDLLFSDTLPERAVAAYVPRLQDESYRAFLELIAIALRSPRPRRVPTLVLGGAADRIFGVAEVEATARAYGTRAEIFPGAPHDLMLEPSWRPVAERLVGWLGEQGF